MKYLIIIDMQNDFITGSLGTKEAQQILPNVVEKVKKFQGKVWYTMDTHSAEYQSTQEGTWLPVEHCIKGTDGWRLAKELEVLSNGCRIVEKPTFGSMELAEELKQCVAQDTIEEIELCGLCTDICVISNALLLKAAMPEVPIVVDASCCAGVTPESHQNALKAMEMCQVHIKNA